MQALLGTSASVGKQESGTNRRGAVDTAPEHIEAADSPGLLVELEGEKRGTGGDV